MYILIFMLTKLEYFLNLNLICGLCDCLNHTFVREYFNTYIIINILWWDST